MVKNGHTEQGVSLLLLTWIPVVVGVISIAATVSMRRLDFEAQKALLVWFGAFVVILAIAFPFVRLRHGLGFLVVLPFCLYIFANYCGDVGRVHFAESIPMAGGAELLFLLAILKTCYVWIRSLPRGS